jgi:hypothetical protein
MQPITDRERLEEVQRMRSRRTLESIAEDATKNRNECIRNSGMG